jgi:hypothetical protein
MAFITSAATWSFVHCGRLDEDIRNTVGNTNGEPMVGLGMLLHE